MHLKVLMLPIHLRLNDSDNPFHDFTQRDHVHRERHLTALNLGHIQHVIDQSQQMLAGQRNLLQTVLYLFRIIHMGSRNSRHTNDCIHRRPDIMTHIRQEFTLGPGRFFRRRTGFIQLTDLLLAHPVVHEENHQKQQ